MAKGNRQVSLSVIMSIYNESAIEISKSLQSVLSQSYSQFEVVIINDNPARKDELTVFIEQVTGSDDRIALYHNEENIGLAMSMNRAAELANTSVLLRMDADDVCETNRFELAYRELIDGSFDLVCSRYLFIDQDDNIMNSISPYYNDDELKQMIQQWNVIHHPTVIMRREAFIKAGCYRNFPCSQDYDLWLRMLETGAKMHMMDITLLRYRVREKSISTTKTMQQLYTIEYIKKLAMQRKKTGKDEYSIENYNHYLAAQGVFNKKRNERFLKHHGMHRRAQEAIREGNHIHGLLIYLYVFLTERVLFKQMIARKLHRRGKGWL